MSEYSYNSLTEDGSGWALVNAEKMDMNHVYQIDSSQYSFSPLLVSMICVGLWFSGNLFPSITCLDIGSWPKLSNRDRIIEEIKAYDIKNISLYLYTARFYIWFPFCFRSGPSIAKTGLLITVAGPFPILLTRVALSQAENGRLKAVLYSQWHEMYISYYHNNNSDENTNPELTKGHKNHQSSVGGGGGDELKSSVFLPVNGWQLCLAITAAIGLISVGVKLATTQK